MLMFQYDIIFSNLRKAVMKLKILAGSPERDFLTSFKKLLELSENQVETVFDGTQVVSKMAETKFDAVILSDNIPRINCREIVKILNEENIPVIVISDKKTGSGILSDDVLANSYLSLPFFPDELGKRLEDISEKLKSTETVSCFDVEIDVPKFMMCSEIRVTNEEINILKTLLSNGTVDNKRASPYINTLNNKFEKLNKKVRIKYMANESYRLVAENG